MKNMPPLYYSYPSVFMSWSKDRSLKTDSEKYKSKLKSQLRVRLIAPIPNYQANHAVSMTGTLSHFQLKKKLLAESSYLPPLSRSVYYRPGAVSPYSRHHSGIEPNNCNAPVFVFKATVSYWPWGRSPERSKGSRGIWSESAIIYQVLRLGIFPYQLLDLCPGGILSWHPATAARVARLLSPANKSKVAHPPFCRTDKSSPHVSSDYYISFRIGKKLNCLYFTLIPVQFS